MNPLSFDPSNRIIFSLLDNDLFDGALPASLLCKDVEVLESSAGFMSDDVAIVFLICSA